MINIILVKSSNSGNIGAIARVMANFDTRNLILVNPKVNHLSQIAKNRAKHAQSILKNIKVVKKIPEFDYLIATSAITGSAYNKRSPLTVSELKKIIPKNANIGLLIGAEGTGLTNEEIKRADFVVNIVASKKYKTLNISHAVAIILYEISKSNQSINELASKKDRDVLVKYINSTLKKIKFSTNDKLNTQKIVWKRMLSKSFLTKREAYSLIGYFKKISEKIK